MDQCDYARMNGKCGRALCENYGKPCPGRSCEDWKCVAEGEPCIHFGGEDFCPEYKADKITCDKCPKWIAECEKDTAVAVVEPRGGGVSPATYKARVSEAYGRIETAKDNLLRECVKFGALLTEVGYYLGETQGKKGEGLQAWLAENCPEVNYSTAMNYKALAGKCVKMLGGGSQAVAVLQDKTEVIPPGEDAPIDVDSKFIEKRDELFKKATSRRELEQTYFKFMASEGKGKAGRKKGQTAAAGSEPTVRAKTAAEKSAEAEVEMRELIGKLGAFLTRGGKVNMLTQQARDDFHRALVDYAETLAEMM